MMTNQKILDDIRQKPTVPVWPHLANLLGISRGAAYQAVRNGEVESIRVGRSIRVVTAPLRQRLQIVPDQHR
jgi:excisionase family DNA binding protein